MGTVILRQRSPEEPMDWSQNPEGYKQYLEDSKKAQELRERGG